MNVSQPLADVIRARLAPLCAESLEVFDDSADHAGHAGAAESGGGLSGLRRVRGVRGPVAGGEAPAGV